MKQSSAANPPSRRSHPEEPRPPTAQAQPPLTTDELIGTEWQMPVARSQAAGQAAMQQGSTAQRCVTRSQWEQGAVQGNSSHPRHAPVWGSHWKPGVHVLPVHLVTHCPWVGSQYSPGGHLVAQGTSGKQMQSPSTILMKNPPGQGKPPWSQRGAHAPR